MRVRMKLGREARELAVGVGNLQPTGQGVDEIDAALFVAGVAFTGSSTVMRVIGRWQFQA